MNDITSNCAAPNRRAAVTITSTLAAMLCAFVLSLGASLPGFANDARAETRSLKLYFLHTGERAEITYKRNGRYIKSGLDKINRFLRDWRRNEPTKMDPALLDLIWEVYQESGSKKAIHVISAYRSPSTNNLLRKRGRGVAKTSQHTLGKALDFYLPDVKLSKLRAIGLRKGLGGVGYYPKSGSPFVHMDTGSVRHWPRMSRKELVRIFPKGGTLHVPTDGKPLAGYNQALAAYKRKKSGVKVQIVDEKERKRPNFFERLVGADDTEDEETTTPPAPRPVKTQPAPATPSDPASAEVQIAALPSRVPVPVLAPRSGGINSGAEIQIASNTASDLDANIDGPQEEEATLELAAIPVPSRRPQIAETMIAALTDTNGNAETPGNSELADPETTLAFATPAPRPQSSLRAGTPDGEIVQVAALSPSEIENLRREVSTALSPSVAPATSLPSSITTTVNSNTRPPIPAVAIGNADNTPDTAKPDTETPIIAAQNNAGQINGNGSTPTIANEVANSQDDRIEVASLEVATSTEPVVETAQGTPDPAAPVPTARPSIEAETPVIQTIASGTGDAETTGAETNIVETAAADEATSDSLTVAAIEPLEPGVRSTLDIALPSPNPASSGATRDTETAPVEIATLDDDIVRSGGQALPLPNPNRVTVEASPERAPTAEEPVSAPVQVAALETDGSEATLRERPITLEEFSMPAVGENRIGKWALAADTTIKRINDIRPPAYGKNSIRILPSKVLVAGFTKTAAAPDVNRFSGRAVEFQPYQNFTN